MNLSDLLTRLINSQDHTRDVKLAAYGLVVIVTIAWLTWKAFDSFNNIWVDVFYGLCALVGLGGPFWGIVDNMKGKRDPIPPEDPK